MKRVLAVAIAAVFFAVVLGALGYTGADHARPAGAPATADPDA